jgi:tRNA (guanine37-N1)-methyltransferase
MALSEILRPRDLTCVHNSYDIVGDIAVVRLSGRSKRYGESIARTIMAVHKNVKTVLAQTGAVCGEFRLRKLEYVAGEDKTRTVHRESGCRFSVDIEKCYFSPRLFHERMRVAGLVKDGETIVNMFAGAGCFSVVIAKYSNAKRVYSIDINPVALKYMLENIRVNKAYSKIIPILADAKNVIQERLCCVADRVLMPLPEKALEYLPSALRALRESGGWIHYYDFEHARKNEDPIDKVRLKVSDKLGGLDIAFEIPYGRVVRSTGPNWHQIVLDIRVEPSRKENPWRAFQ